MTYVFNPDRMYIAFHKSTINHKTVPRNQKSIVFSSKKKKKEKTQLKLDKCDTPKNIELKKLLLIRFAVRYTIDYYARDYSSSLLGFRVAFCVIDRDKSTER